MDSVLPISDDCEMYLVRTEAHEQHVEGKDEFERKPLIVNGIDNTITLEIDKETLMERLQEYYVCKVNPGVVLPGHEFFGTYNNGIHFRLLKIKRVKLKSRDCCKLYFHLYDGSTEQFYPILIETGAYLACGNYDCVKLDRDTAGTLIVLITLNTFISGHH